MNREVGDMINKRGILMTIVFYLAVVPTCPVECGVLPKMRCVRYEGLLEVTCAQKPGSVFGEHSISFNMIDLPDFFSIHRAD